jgi:signal transduction histidine kinase
MKARVFALKELVKSNSRAAKQAQVIDAELDRLERIVRDVLDFARPSEPHLETADLPSFLKAVHQLVLPDMEARNIQFSLELLEKGKAQIDQQQLKQVLLNLLRNAAESCPEVKGEIALGLDRINGNLRLFVRDNGNGISEEIREKVFRPFFSQKPAGTGLGLSISQNIVKKHGATLEFETNIGLGSLFYIDLAEAD